MVRPKNLLVGIGDARRANARLGVARCGWRRGRRGKEVVRRSKFQVKGLGGSRRARYVAKPIDLGARCRNQTAFSAISRP